MALHNQLGKAGELAACRYLMNKGYRILAVNWHYKNYEADILATDRRTLIAIEVKTRTSSEVIEATNTIDRDKKRHIISVAHAFRREKRIDLPLRYDVIVALYSPAQGVFEITHYKNFFEEGDVQNFSYCHRFI